MADIKEFVVNDRRKFTAEGEVRPDAPPSVPKPPRPETLQPHDDTNSSARLIEHVDHKGPQAVPSSPSPSQLPPGWCRSHRHDTTSLTVVTDRVREEPPCADGVAGFRGPCLLRVRQTVPNQQPGEPGRSRLYPTYMWLLRCRIAWQGGA